MRFRKRVYFIALLCILIPVFSGCKYHVEPQSLEFFAMDTVNVITIYDLQDNGSSFRSAEDQKRQMNALLNQAARFVTEKEEALTGGTVLQSEASEDMILLLQKADAYIEDTNGAFNPHLYPLEKAWGFTDGNTKVPSEEEISATLKECRENVDLYDLGGIYKGYVAGALKQFLIENGVTSASIVLGGNVTVIGTEPSGKPFSVGIKDPVETAKIIASLRVEDTSVVTSGGYERFFTEDGVTYSHILDPETGYPVSNDLLSVTVICKDDVLADALSTALFVMGKEKAESFYRSNVFDFDMVLIDENRQMFITKGIQEVFSEKENFVVID